MSNLADFVVTHLGVATDVDGAFGAQCVDLVQAWADAIGMPRFSGNAIDLAGQPNPGATWIPAGQGLPLPGDVVVWGETDSLGIGPLGHTDIVVDGVTVTGFRGLDQNWFDSSPDHGSSAAFVNHDYRGVLGWHHFKALDPAPIPTPEEDDMPIQNWVLPPRRFEPTDKPIYLPDINCNLDDLYVAAAGCDEGDGEVEVDVTDGTDKKGPVKTWQKLSFTASDDGGPLRQSSGVVRVVIKPPSAPCWISAKVQAKGR